MRRLVAGLLLATVLATTGCGTLINVCGRGEAVPFGGVVNDVRWVRYAGPNLAVVGVLDLPLSAVLDVVTLPLVMGVWIVRNFR